MPKTRTYRSRPSSRSPQTRITTRLLRSQKATIAALAVENGVSFNDQLVAMLWDVLKV